MTVQRSVRSSLLVLLLVSAALGGTPTAVRAQTDEVEPPPAAGPSTAGSGSLQMLTPRARPAPVAPAQPALKDAAGTATTAPPSTPAAPAAATGQDLAPPTGEARAPMRVIDLSRQKTDVPQGVPQPRPDDAFRVVSPDGLPPMPTLGGSPPPGLAPSTRVGTAPAKPARPKVAQPARKPAEPRLKAGEPPPSALREPQADEPVETWIDERTGIVVEVYRPHERGLREIPGRYGPRPSVRWQDDQPYALAPFPARPPGVIFEPRPHLRAPATFRDPRLDSCHYHAYRDRNVGRMHREVECHWHENARHPSLIYVD